MESPVAPDAAPDAAPALCASCGAPMAAEQDWCLACGTAAPQRIGELPGLRTAGKVGLLTLVLLVVAVAASYAALNHGGKTTLVASIPAAVAPPAPATTATTPAPAPHTTTTTAASVPSSPPVAPPPQTTPTDVFPTDTAPATPASTPTPAPTPAPRSTTPATTPSKTLPKTTEITLGKNAVALYDPLTRVVSSSPPALAHDDDPSTLFTINTGPSTDGVQAGTTIDLAKVRNATEIKLETPTPGFSVGIYGAVGPKIPATLTDPAWKHLHNATDLGSVDGDAVIQLGTHGKGVSTYRYLLIWITNPPPPATAATRDAPPITVPTSTVPAVTATTTSVPPTTTTSPPPTVPVVPSTVPTTTTTPAPVPGGATVSIAELSVFG